MSKRVLWVVEGDVGYGWEPSTTAQPTKKEAKRQACELREDMRIDGMKIIPMQVTKYVPAEPRDGD